MFCTKCGHQIAEDEKFCTNCGTAIEYSKGKVQKKANRNTKIIYVIIAVLILLFATVFCLKKINLQKNAALKDAEITVEKNLIEETTEAETNIDDISQDEMIDYSEKYNNLIYEQIGVVKEKEIIFNDEDIVLKEGFYQVNNPNKEEYYGVVGSKLTDLNQDGKKEVFAVCTSEDNYGTEKDLRISLKEFEWDNKGALEEKIQMPSRSQHMYISVRLWDKVDSERIDYQHIIEWKVFYVEKENIPYILLVAKLEGKYREEYEVSVYSIDETSRQSVYRKIGYNWDFTQTRPTIEYEEYDKQGCGVAHNMAFGVDDEFYTLLNSMINTLAGYGINLSVINNETVIDYDNKCELIAEVEIQPNKLGEVSGYKIALNGDVIPVDKEENTEIIDGVQNEQTESNRTTVNYQREHEISEYEDLMLAMEICFWDDSFDNVNSIEDISTYIAYFVSYDYPYEMCESWYNTEKGLYEISGEVVRKTMNKYFAFHDLKLENHLPTTPNHNQGNYWYDQEKDMYYGWIGGFGGTHDGYNDIKFEILDYGVVKAIGTWNMEDGSLATTEIVVEESEDGLMRLKSYKHSVGEPVEYSLSELEQMALDYRKRHGLYACKVAVDNEMGDMVLIHCYEVVIDNPATGEGHTATSDWYTVNRYTAIGTNDAGEYIDLKN